MKLKEWCQSKERTIVRLLLVILLMLVGSFLLLENCTPLSFVADKLWGFVNRLISAAWSGLEWPHAVLLIFALMLLNYKSEIGAFIQRVDEVGPSGVKAHRLVPPVSAAEAEAATGTVSADSGTAVAADSAPDVADAEQALPGTNGLPLPPVYFPGQMRQTREYLVEEIGRVPELDRINYLLDHLAYCRVWGDFESTYSIALGGQLNLLNEISLNFPNGMPAAVVERLWQEHQAKLKPALDQWTGDQYVWLLKSRHLLLDNNGLLAITAKGREFLAWMSSSGKSPNKPW